VGAGAGFPGIPLAIMLPEIEITLLDSLGKRVDFMKSAIEALGLNARAVNLRAEEAGRVQPSWPAK
jgi:16S rRNA (guanine527-N7)-methyltransferase